MKRSPLKKKSKSPLKKAEDALWELCKQITRKRWGNSCYTCPAKNLGGRNWQTGHMWAKAALGAYMKYDLRILKPQCLLCNLRRGGMGAQFYANMLREIGPEAMEKLEQDRNVYRKSFDHYLMLIEEYKKILND